MADHHLPGVPPVPLILRKSTRARRMTLRISQLDGRVTLTMPRGVPEREAMDFARSREDWIRRHLAGRPVEQAVDLGGEVPVEGRILRIVEAGGRRVTLGEAEIAVPRGPVGPRLQGYLKTLARDRLATASDHYAAALGVTFSKITLRDTRSRWGSCTSDGALMYSWRLVMAPPEVLRYVAAHEVAHLAEMNHSPAFWAEVERIYGPYQEARGWLRGQGNALHLYRF